MGRVKKSKQKKANKSQEPINPKGQDQQVQKVMMYTGVAVIAIAIIFVVLRFMQGNPPLEFDMTGQPSLGSPDAPVTVIEFGDWKCPHCKQFHDLAFPQLKEEYIDTDQVEFYFVNFPLSLLGPDSRNAALGAECVYDMGEEYFWRYYDAIYENQQPEHEIWATPEFLADQVELHVNPEVDRDAFISCITDEEFGEVVDADFRLGADSGVASTPSIFVNGVISASNYGTLSSDIEAALNQTEEQAAE